MSAHTPGKWRATDRRPVSGNWGSRIPFAIEVANGSSVAPIADVCDQPHAEANARLIAAAPDMLAALMALSDALPSDEHMAAEGRSPGPGLRMMRAAIAKATGDAT